MSQTCDVGRCVEWKEEVLPLMFDVANMNF
jgi:hypothetical protein